MTLAAFVRMYLEAHSDRRLEPWQVRLLGEVDEVEFVDLGVLSESRTANAARSPAAGPKRQIVGLAAAVRSVDEFSD